MINIYFVFGQFGEQDIMFCMVPTWTEDPFIFLGKRNACINQELKKKSKAKAKVECHLFFSYHSIVCGRVNIIGMEEGQIKRKQKRGNSSGPPYTVLHFEGPVLRKLHNEQKLTR